MKGGGFDRVSLVAGIAFALLGAVLCLDRLDVIALGGELMAAAICAAAGAVLVAAGLSPEQGDGG